MNQIRRSVSAAVNPVSTAATRWWCHSALRHMLTGYGSAARQRQLIRHGHWTVNGRRVNIPSYQVRPGDVIAIKASTPASQVVRDATELTGQIPAWLQADHESLTAKVLRKPERREVAAPVQEQLIVELYSK